VVGLLFHRESLYVLSANAQLYRVPAAGGRVSPPVSLKVRPPYSRCFLPGNMSVDEVLDWAGVTSPA
jgi:hypothetical protein